MISIWMESSSFEISLISSATKFLRVRLIPYSWSWSFFSLETEGKFRLSPSPLLIWTICLFSCSYFFMLSILMCLSLMKASSYSFWLFLIGFIALL